LGGGHNARHRLGSLQADTLDAFLEDELLPIST
jgi:hypothetical protein